MESFLKYAGKIALGPKYYNFGTPITVSMMFLALFLGFFLFILKKKFHDFAMYILPVFCCAFHTILDHYCTVWNKEEKLRENDVLFPKYEKRSQWGLYIH